MVGCVRFCVVYIIIFACVIYLGIFRASSKQQLHLYYSVLMLTMICRGLVGKNFLFVHTIIFLINNLFCNLGMYVGSFSRLLISGSRSGKYDCSGERLLFRTG